MQCNYPRSRISDGQSFPCGTCVACRINKARIWTARIIMESSTQPRQESQRFCTFTVDDDHQVVTTDGSLTLDRRPGELFRMDLRNKLGRQPRFFWCGEYGDRTSRPHYHAIFFDLPDGFAEKHFQDLWGQGFVSTSWFTPERAAYVAHYTTKKVTGERADGHYGQRLPEFSQKSRLPALGDEFILRLGEAMKTPRGVKSLMDTGDVPQSFRYSGKFYPIGPRHRRMLRVIVGLPKDTTSIHALRPDLAEAVELKRNERFEFIRHQQDEVNHAQAERQKRFKRPAF